MSQSEWKNKLAMHSAYSRIAMQTDNFEYFKARQTLSAATTLLDQHINTAGNIQGYSLTDEKTPVEEDDKETALIRKQMFDIAQDGTTLIQHEIESLTKEASGLIRSCLAHNVDRADVRAKLWAKQEETKKAVGGKMDDIFNKAMKVIEGSPEEKRDALADMWLSVTDDMMVTIKRLIEEHSASVAQSLGLVEQILQRSETSKSFTQTTIEALVAAVKIMLLL